MVPRRRCLLVVSLWYPDTPCLRFLYHSCNSTSQKSQTSRCHRHPSTDNPRSSTMSSACYFLVYFLSYLPRLERTATRKLKTLLLRSLPIQSHSDTDILRRSRFVHGIYSASTEFAFRTQPLPLNDTRLTNKCRDYVIVGRVWQKQVNDFVTARWARMYACT